MSGHVDVRAYAELNDFLAPALRGTTMRRPFRSHQTVKDVIEAVGIPHTEVDLILADGESVGFAHRPTSGDRLAVYPVFESLDIAPVGRLRPTPLRDPRFVVDINLGRLARLLRLVGFDVRCDRHLDDAALAAIGEAERRIVADPRPRPAQATAGHPRPLRARRSAVRPDRRGATPPRPRPPAGAVHPLPALRRPARRGEQGRRARPAGAADPPALRRLRPLRQLRPGVLEGIPPPPPRGARRQIIAALR